MIKPDSSQVTTADLAVDQLLKERLLKAYPKDGWLSEESPDDRQRLKTPRVWVLDPIDGTRNFISNILNMPFPLLLSKMKNRLSE